MGRALLAVLIVAGLVWGGWRATGAVRGGDSPAAGIAGAEGVSAAADRAQVAVPAPDAHARPPALPPEATALRALLAAGSARQAVARARQLDAAELADAEVAGAALAAARALAETQGSSPAERLSCADEARRLLGRLLVHSNIGGAEWETRLGDLNREVLSAGRELPGTTLRLEVPPGATLDGLLRGAWRERVRVSPGFVLHLNGVASATRLRPGPLTVPTEALRIVVRKRQHLLRVLLGDVPYRAFPVGLGMHGGTPEGKFVIEERIARPDYWPPGGKRVPFGAPGNPLGTRWLGFKDRPDARGFGIHGTVEPESIGKDLSQGCVRLLNGDVETLFEWIPVGTEVEILP